MNKFIGFNSIKIRIKEHNMNLDFIITVFKLK